MLKLIPAAILSILLFSAIAQSAPEQNLAPETWIAKGDLSYQAGNYALAAQAYGRAIEGGLINADALYNKANALYRLGKIGEAIALYRKALQFNPRDPDLRANLALARKRAVDNLEKPSTGLPIGISSILAPRSRFSSYEISVAALLCYGLFWTLFALRSMDSRRSYKTALYISGTLSLYLILLVLGARETYSGDYAFALSPKSHSIRPAVITEQEVKLHSGDSENFQVVFLLHEGAEVEIADTRGEWSEVLLPDGRSGWAKKSALEIL